MSKIWIKLKDKTSTYWLAEQNVSLVGEVPKQVEKTGLVSRLLKNGVAETVNEDYAKKYFLSKEDKEQADQDEKKLKDMENLVSIIKNKINGGEIELAKQMINKCVKDYGDDCASVVDILKKDLEKKIKAIQDEEKRKEELKKLIDASLEAKIIVKDESGFSIDGKIIAETDEELAGYLSKSKKVREAIEKKLANPK